MTDADSETLNKTLEDGLIYTYTTAALDTKQSLIGTMESGALIDESMTQVALMSGFTAIPLS